MPRPQFIPSSAPSTLPLVLVADPDPDTRALYRQILELHGYEVTEAADGREALTQALMRAPNIVISELRLPLIDGYGFCDILRRDTQTRGARIVIVTTEARATEHERIRQLGADATYVKPVAIETVLEDISSALAVADAATHPPAANTVAPTPVARSRATRHKGTVTREFAEGPTLWCPGCDTLLVYQRSHLSGAGRTERWDEYECPTCGPFTYRHRTRKLRRRSEE